LVLVGLAAFLHGGFAGAEPSAAELAAARDAFREARQAEDGGDWAGALEKLKAVAAVKMTVQVRFHLGLCHEQLGFLVEAMNDFELAAVEASEQRIGSVASEAPEHAARIRERLPKLTLAMPADAPLDPKITIDGGTIGSTLASRPIPVNPGSHDIEVRAPGRIFRGTITIAEKEALSVQIVFSPVPVEVSSAAPAASAAPVAPSPAQPAERRAGGATVGWVMVGTGSAVLVGAGVSGLVWMSARSSIDDKCPTHQNCTPDVQSDQDRATTFGLLGPILGGVGVAAVVTGVVLVATSRKASTPVAITPWATGREAGATATVRF
jgi:hypothetical protein